MPYSRYIFGNIPWYSILILFGMVLAIFLASREEKRVGLPKDTIIDLCLFMLPAGIIGARLYYVIFAWEEYAANPVSALYIWNGGLAIYGGVIAGLVTAVIFARKRKIPVPLLLDIIAPCVVLAQAIGRWGNFFNMEAYGLPVENPLCQFFPLAVLIPENGENVWHMATFFYESCWNLLAFCLLWCGRKKSHRQGDIFFGYVLLYGCGRFVIEGLRMDSLMSFTGDLRVSQWLAFAGAFLAAGLLLSRRIKKADEARCRQAMTLLAVCTGLSAVAAVVVRQIMLLPLLASYVVCLGSIYPCALAKKKMQVFWLFMFGTLSAVCWICSGVFLPGWVVPFLRCCCTSLLLIFTSALNYTAEEVDSKCLPQS